MLDCQLEEQPAGSEEGQTVGILAPRRLQPKEAKQAGSRGLHSKGALAAGSLPAGSKDQSLCRGANLLFWKALPLEPEPGRLLQAQLC